MTTRNDVKVTYNDRSRRTAFIPEGTTRQQMAAYEALPPRAREALRNAAYDHSPYQLRESAKMMGWSEQEMVEAVARADERKRTALVKTGYLILAA